MCRRPGEVDLAGAGSFKRAGALAQLVENPTADPDADHNRRSDQWSVPLGEEGFLFYAVVRDPATVIVLRLVSFG